MQRVALGQISLDAAPERARPAIVLSNLSVSGKFENEGLLLLKASMHPEEETPQLAHGETVIVTLSDENGEVFASTRGTVEVGFKDKSVEGTLVTVREQRVKL